MTRDEARKLREAFGYCSSVYECLSLEDIISEVERYGVAGFVKASLAAEEVYVDRSNEAAYQLEASAGIGSHAEVVSENKRFIAEMKKRLKEGGFL